MVQIITRNSVRLLPPCSDKCPICATDHKPEEPHNAASLYYQHRFLGAHGRWPTWADAIAHCNRKLQDLWREELQARGKWSEPEGDPIADPPDESFHQVIDLPTS